MSDEQKVQLADGSWRLKQNSRQCCLCNKWYLLDEAKDRGDGRIICEECARANNINFCRICGAKINYQYHNIQIYQCQECQNLKSADYLSQLKKKKEWKKIIRGTNEEYRHVVFDLIKLGEAQKAGIIRFVNSDTEKRIWSLEND